MLQFHDHLARFRVIAVQRISQIEDRRSGNASRKHQLHPFIGRPGRELFLDLRDELRDAREPVRNGREARIGNELGAADDFAKPLPKPRIVRPQYKIPVLRFDRLVWRAHSVRRADRLRPFAGAPVLGRVPDGQREGRFK